MSDLTKKLKTTGALSTRQIDTARIRLHKYAKFLEGLTIEDVDVQTPDGLSKSFRFMLHNQKKFRVFAPDGSPIMAQIERLTGFVRSEKHWTCDATKRNGHVLINCGFVMDDRAKNWMEKPPAPIPQVEIIGVNAELRDFQKDGVAFLVSRNGNGIIADEMGMGKTVQAIAYAQTAGLKKILICTIASHKLGFVREITKFTGETNIHAIEGIKVSAEQTAAIKAAKWLTINYDILPKWKDVLAKAKIDCFVLDEVHSIKNHRAKRSKAAKSLANKIPHVVALSGTPFENRPIELHGVIQMVDPALFPFRISYADKFCALQNNNMSGASNTKELHKILTDTIMIRRTKAEFLPGKQRVVIPVHLSNSQSKEYLKIENDFIKWLKEKDIKKSKAAQRAMAIVKLAALKKFVAECKVKLAIDWIDNYLLADDPKLIVFAWHHEILDALKSHYGKRAVMITGKVPTNKRLAIQDQFQNDPKINLFLGQIKAAGAAITLTAAKSTLTIEYAWTSTAHDQAEDRAHRIGQSRDVTSYYMLAENTIDIRIASIIDQKRQVFTEVIDGVDMEIEAGLIENLLKQYRLEGL